MSSLFKKTHYYKLLLNRCQAIINVTPESDGGADTDGDGSGDSGDDGGDDTGRDTAILRYLYENMIAF
jgi:hypothetical protein